MIGKVSLLNADTGELTIPTLSMILGPSFTRNDLFALPITLRSMVENEPHHSYSIGQYEIGGPIFAVSLYFYGQKLEAISFADTADKFGTSWGDWSEEKEQNRKQAHDRWLNEQLGKRGRLYKWGEVGSSFDQKSGGSSIMLRYSWQGVP